MDQVLDQLTKLDPHLAICFVAVLLGVALIRFWYEHWSKGRADLTTVEFVRRKSVRWFAICWLLSCGALFATLKLNRMPPDYSEGHGLYLDCGH